MDKVYIKIKSRMLVKKYGEDNLCTVEIDEVVPVDKNQAIQLIGINKAELIEYTSIEESFSLSQKIGRKKGKRNAS